MRGSYHVLWPIEEEGDREALDRLRCTVSRHSLRTGGSCNQSPSHLRAHSALPVLTTERCVEELGAAESRERQRMRIWCTTVLICSGVL